MRFLVTASSVIGSFCIIAIAIIVVLMIWGLEGNELVGKMLLSLATIYIGTLLIAGVGKSGRR